MRRQRVRSPAYACGCKRGGTGGHIFPALAVAEALKRRQADAELLYIGGSTGMEAQIVPPTGLPFRAVTARKLRQVVSPSTLLVALSLVRGYAEAKRAMREFRAQAVVGTGGYVAAAAVLAGVRMGLPTLIVAPDLLPGRTNLWLARWVQRICITFEASRDRYPADRTALTGMPLRSQVVAPAELTPAGARCHFKGLSAEAFTVLVVGGSQGAQALNRIVLEATPSLLDAGAQILHQTGVRNIEEVRRRAAENAGLTGGGYLPLPFLDEAEMASALRAADVLVCRGGISSLSEATACGLPLLVVPLPSAYADHQTFNARALEATGAALHRPQEGLTGAGLAEDILVLKGDPARRAKMAAASKAQGRPDAADRVADELMKLIRGCH